MAEAWLPVVYAQGVCMEEVRGHWTGGRAGVILFYVTSFILDIS